MAQRDDPAMVDKGPATQRERAASYFAATVNRWEAFYLDAGEQTVYATVYRLRMEVALRLAEACDLPAHARCLDIGCGPGIATVSLAQRGFAVDAVDLIEAQLDRVRSRAADQGVADRVATSIGDVHHLEFPDGAFDLVLAIGVMEWLENPEAPLREVARVLKPGGHAILSVDNKWAFRNLFDPLTCPPLLGVKRLAAKLLAPLRRRRPGPRDYAYSIGEFDRLTANAGLEKRQGVTVGFGPFSLFGFELPQRAGLALHHRLQSLANRHFPVLRSGGFVYVTALAKKPGRE